MAKNEDPNNDESAEVVSLDQEQSRKFLKIIADDPFITMVVADDGVVRVFSKDIEPEHLDRIKHVLGDLTKGK